MGGLAQRFKSSGLGRFYQKYSSDRADEGAILIAWQTVFSLFPLIIGGLSILGLILRSPERRSAFTEAVVAAFPGQVSELLTFVEETRQSGGILGLIGLVSLLYTGSNLFGQMSTVFNRVYNAPERSFIWARLMSFSMIGIFLVLAFLSVAASGAAHFIVDIADWLFGFPLEGIVKIVATLIGTALSFASAFVMFLALYKVVPNLPLTLRDVWKGAALSAVLYLVLNLLLPFYFQFFGGGYAAYKTLGLFLILLFYFLLASRVIVVGAVLNAFLAGVGPAVEAAMPNTGQEAQDNRGAAGRRRSRGARHQPAAAAANGHADSAAAGKRILWAAISAGVTGLTLTAAERTASGIWRALIGGAPPRKGKSPAARLTDVEAGRHLKF